MDVRLLAFYAAISLAIFHSTCVGAFHTIHIARDTENIADADSSPARGDGLIESLSESSNDTTTNKYTSSSSESSSHEHDRKKKADSSESSESYSSEEIVNKKIRKRSLESTQESVNIIGNEENPTNVAKQNEDNHKDVTAVEDNKEPSTSDETISTTTSEASTTETVTLGEISVTEPESTTSETDSESGINASESVVVVTESESGSTTLTENEATTTESESGTTIPTDTTFVEENKESDESESSTPDAANEDKVDQSTTSKENVLDVGNLTVNKLSDQIRLVLMQYRKQGAVVIPGKSIFPEPMKLQDLQQSISVGTLNMMNMSAYGLSNFTVEHVNTDVDRMQVYVALKMKKIVILGNYTMRTFFNRASGPFNVTLLEVDSEGAAEVETTADGHLEATDSEMDMFTKNMLLDFKNMGFLGSMFQGAAGAVGDAVFNSIKPQILERVNVIIRSDVNKKLKDFSVKFINKISPVQLAFSEGRKYVREHGYDPFNIGNHSFSVGGLMTINVTNLWLEGLSKFYRVGNLSISMDSGVVEVGVHVATQQLSGKFNWSARSFGIVKSGKTNFTVDHLQVRALVNQSLDIRKKPQLDKLDLELGWVKVKMDSDLTLNMMVEGIINAFPRLIRHMIVDTLEKPLKEKVQEILDQINVEEVVKTNLPRLDSFGI